MSPPNLVVVVVDSLRRDALGCYGGQPGATPELDALARDALRFDAAFATSSFTVPAVASLWTGRRPAEHGVEALGERLSKTMPTLAQTLSRGGYSTGAVVGEFRVGAARGFDQGFESFYDEVARADDEVSSRGVTDKASELLTDLAEGEEPFFAWIHFNDPRASWFDREEFAFADTGLASLRGGESLAELRLALSDQELTERDRNFLRAVYAEEVAAVDACVGELLDLLEELDVADDTLFVLTSTHGQEFFERGDLGPATSLFQEQVAVPLIVRPPVGYGRTRGQVIDVPVSLGGLAATLAEIADLAPASQNYFVLPSFAPVLRGSGQAPGPIIFELDYAPAIENRTERRLALEGATDGRFKLVRDRASGALQLFDLALDPGETKNIAELYPGPVESLSKALERVEL